MFKRTFGTIILGGCFFCMSCGDEDEPVVQADAGDGGVDADGGTETDAGRAGPRGMAHPPMLGAQVDRMGRPAIATALIRPFESNTELKNERKDAYNADADSASWAADYAAEMKGSLGVLDALDTVCGNQLAADLGESRYTFLANVLADDQLYLNMGSETCTTYLAVEADALGVENADCGGRTPTYDVIDQSYTVLATGGLDAAVGDQVDADDSVHDSSTFPFLAAARGE